MISITIDTSHDLTDADRAILRALLDAITPADAPAPAPSKPATARKTTPKAKTHPGSAEALSVAPEAAVWDPESEAKAAEPEPETEEKPAPVGEILDVEPPTDTTPLDRTVVMAKAKEFAAAHGKPALAEKMKAVGASKMSEIPEARFADFVNSLAVA